MKEITIEEFMKRCEDLQETADELYIKGFDNGKEHGMDEAWECAKKIADMKVEDLERIFGLAQLSNIIFDFSAAEAMQKIKDYEVKRCDTCQRFGNECDGHAFGCKDYEEITECEILNDKCLSPNKECDECPVCQKYELTKKKCKTCYYNTTEYSVCQMCNNGDLYSKYFDEEDEELDFVQENPTIPITITSMREATPEELKGVHDYIESISTKTSVNFYDKEYDK